VFELLVVFPVLALALAQLLPRSPVTRHYVVPDEATGATPDTGLGQSRS
jgi:hypothetical protein